MDEGDLRENRLCALKARSGAVDEDGNDGGLAAADEFWADPQSTTVTGDRWLEGGIGVAPDLQHLDDLGAEVEDQRTSLVEAAAGNVPATPRSQGDLQQMRVIQLAALMADL